jgi:hypothetical protein
MCYTEPNEQDEFMEDDPFTAGKGDSMATCPLSGCGVQVSQSWLDQTKAQFRFTGSVSDMFTIHETHMALGAKAEYQQKGYPNVDWVALRRRLRSKRYMKRVEALVTEETSEFWIQYEQRARQGKRQVQAGQDGSLEPSMASLSPVHSAELLEAVRAMEETVSPIRTHTIDRNRHFVPGYYGERGHDIIHDHLSRSFKNLVEAKALERGFKKWGDPAFYYIQNVLVPEVAIELIREDKGLSWEEAKKVMEESAGLGALVNPTSQEFESEDED